MRNRPPRKAVVPKIWDSLKATFFFFFVFLSISVCVYIVAASSPESFQRLQGREKESVGTDGVLGGGGASLASLTALPCRPPPPPPPRTPTPILFVPPPSLFLNLWQLLGEMIQLRLTLDCQVVKAAEQELILRLIKAASATRPTFRAEGVATPGGCMGFVFFSCPRSSVMALATVRLVLGYPEWLVSQWLLRQ